jgi:Raf kinase inhibitor-like YbhB/YbcL family protein
MNARRWQETAILACLLAGYACGDDDDHDHDSDHAGSSAAVSTAGKSAAGRGASGASGSKAGTGASAGGASGASGASGKGGAGGKAGAAGSTDVDDAGTSDFTLTSGAVDDGQMLPVKYRCEDAVGGPTGPNPPLAWSGAPSDTKSFAVILRDRSFNNYQHWTIYDIPQDTTSLPEGVATGAAPDAPEGAKQAGNSPGLTGPGYYGPCGPADPHMYEFKVYALDVATLDMAGTTGASVETQLELHDLATASLTVTSGKP